MRSPKLVEAVIPVDNAPVDAALKSDFVRYIQGLRSINDAAVIKQIEADSILQKYEKVWSRWRESPHLSKYLNTDNVRSHLLYANSSSQT